MQYHSRNTFFHLSRDPSFSLSENGKWLVFIRDIDGIPELHICSASASLSDTRRLTHSTEEKVIFAAPYEPIRWVVNDKMLIFARIEKGGIARYLISVKDAVERMVHPTQASYTYVSNIARGDKDRIAFTTSDRDARYRDWAILELPSLKQLAFYKNELGWDELLLDGDLLPQLMTIILSDGSIEIRHFKHTEKAPVITIGPQESWSTRVLELSADGKELYLKSSIGRNTAALTSIDL